MEIDATLGLATGEPHNFAQSLGLAFGEVAHYPLGTATSFFISF